MWSLINHPSNMVFTVALGLMVFIGVIETICFLVGGVSDWFDGLLPEILQPDFQSDVAVDGAAGGLMKLLSWLYVGKVPLLIWLVVFLGVYGALGLVVQHGIHSVIGDYLNTWLASSLVLLLSLPVVRTTAKAVSVIMPHDETTAMSHDDFIGRSAQIILGQASMGSPAQAKLKDPYGQTHYIMVEPDTDEVLAQGSVVLLVSKNQHGFTVILDPHPH